MKRGTQVRVIKNSGLPLPQYPEYIGKEGIVTAIHEENLNPIEVRLSGMKSSISFNPAELQVTMVIMDIKKIWIRVDGITYVDHYSEDMDLTQIESELLRNMIDRMESYIQFLQDTTGRMAEELRKE